RVFRVYFYDVVEAILADVVGRDVQRSHEVGRRWSRFVRFEREIEFDLALFVQGGEDFTPGREADFVAGGLLLLPEDVRRGQRGVAAQVHFAFRGEPAQVEMVGLPDEEGRLREIHLPGDGLQPAILSPGREQADRRRIAGEGAVSEGVNVE